ncbi:MAG: ThiF family adenylyltransferase [Acutalibacteraceae bacterium]
MSIFLRTEMLLGTDGMQRLQKSRVAVFGVGGVGGYAVEALVRSGIGSIDIFDNDTVCESNLNRQIIATTKTIGMYKVDAMKQRILDINPDADVNAFNVFYTPENSSLYPIDKYDYVIDAIDTVTSKIHLICECYRANVPIMSAMGAGNKLNAAMLEVEDIYRTSGCPLARVMRRELKARGIKHLKVVYSKEPAITPLPLEEKSASRRQTPGSTAFVPGVAGLIIAGEVVKDLSLKP